MNNRVCRYGTGCRKPGCLFSHPTQSQTSSFGAPSYGSSSYGGGSYSSSQPCRYGSSCNRSDCKFYHGGAYNTYSAPPPCRYGAECTYTNCMFSHESNYAGEPTDEEQQYMDEILDMIEQEQAQGQGFVGDEEDDKNIDEIYRFINNQQKQGESDSSIPEGADEEFEAMMHQTYSQKQQPNQQSNSGTTDGLESSMSKLNVKGLSATSAPFVPKN
eukprot:TRINITY_DN7597_c0_g1_i1.p1 TRINITY_DN7597_c0_g1~~TRINITY_DN7597_c0_g1_i1.p1  ORF type:complete len:215 (+),score=69.84 TRINITY_DN7597_c0_g1_i1:77-721(+)